MAKTLKRFLVSGSLGNPDQKQKVHTISLTREETHHLRDVLRIKEGGLCLLFDREGHEFVSRFERFLPEGRSEARILDPAPVQEEGLLKLTVAQAVPQDRKMDEIVRKSAELGTFELIPLVTERTIVRMAKEQSRKAHERWERIAEQTLKQSRLSKAPKISFPTSFDELCSRFSEYDQTFLLHPSPDAKSIRDCRPIQKGSATHILLAIGPEGGFAPQEVERAKVKGAQIIRMGSGILKTDTAFVAAASFFKMVYS